MNGTLEKLSRELSLVCGGARMHAVETLLYVYVCVCVYSNSPVRSICVTVWPTVAKACTYALL